MLPGTAGDVIEITFTIVLSYDVLDPGSGWTSFTDNASVKKIYVKNGGNDGNDGSNDANAVATLARARELLDSTKSNWVHLKKGSEWSEGFTGWSQGGLSAAQPMLFVSYDIGARPRLNALPGYSWLDSTSGTALNYMAFVGIDFAPRSLDPSDGAYLSERGRRKGGA